MTAELVREIIPRCLTGDAEACPGTYDASVFGKVLICAIHGQEKGT